MQTAEFRDDVVSVALELAWSLWAELSVSGWTRRHSSSAVDVEALILHTSWLGQYDRRLLNESVDWCVSNSRLVSAVRLKNLLRRASEDVKKAFGDFSATVRVHQRIPWPGQGTPWVMVPSGKSGLVDLERPANIQLRLRAILGVSARSEALKLMLSGPSKSWTAAELSVLAAYGKDNVSGALDLLALAGLIDVDRVGNGNRYSLQRFSELKELLGELPASFPHWSAILPVVEIITKFAVTTSNTRPDARSVEAGGTLRQLDDWLKILGLADSTPVATGTSLNYQFDNWAMRLLHQWANIPDPAAGEMVSGKEASYTVNRLTMPPGAWMGVVLNPGERPRPLEMPEWADLYKEQPRSDTIISDDSRGAPRVAHEMMRLAELRAGKDVGDYWTGEGQNQLIAWDFAEERLRPMRSGSSMTWGEVFLRAWRRDRISRIRSTAAGTGSAPTPGAS